MSYQLLQGHIAASYIELHTRGRLACDCEVAEAILETPAAELFQINVQLLLL